MDDYSLDTNRTKWDCGATVTGQREDYVLVPRKPTKEMIEAAWADALAEDAEGVWRSMIEQYESSVLEKREVR
jgi:hypothetical protein